MTAPSRRRCAFSLRTLFVVVAVVACPLGYVCQQWQLVRNRAKIIEWLEAQPDVDIWWAPDMTTHDPPPAFAGVTDWEAIKVKEGENSAYPGILRRRLGDRDIGSLSLGPTPRPDFCSCDRIKALFPEAWIFSLRQDDRAP